MCGSPNRWHNLFSVNPQSASPVVPCALLWWKVGLATAVVLSFGQKPNRLCLGGIHPSVGVGCVVLLRILVEGRHAVASQRTPNMSEVYSCSSSLSHTIGFSFILILFRSLFFGRESFGQLASVWKSVSDVPFDVSLLHITEGIASKGVLLVPEHSTFKVGKSLELFCAFCCQIRSVAVEIFRTAAHPCTFCQCQCVRIKSVFKHLVVFALHQTVVPKGNDASHHILVAFLFAIDGAVVKRYDVSECVEMVYIMVLTVNGRNARSGLAPETPELCHVNFARLVVPTGIPTDNLLAFGPDVGNHFGHKVGIGKTHFVRSDMQIRKVVKRLAHLINEKFQNLHSFGRLHVMSEGTDKCSAVSGHVNFRNEQDMMRLAKIHQFAGFCQGVVFPGHSCGVDAVVQHREDFALQTPCLILGQMPVEHVDFEF